MKFNLRHLRAEAIQLLGEASIATTVELYATAGGEKLTQAAADELLAKAVNRERVSLILHLLSYEQGRRDAKGKIVKNSHGIRVRDGAMAATGRSGKDTPFMRDHLQRDSRAKGGVILESKTVTLTEDGHKQILQVVELREPEAVERALRGLMDAVSVGLQALGPVTCTECGSEIFTKCYHWPFDVVEHKDGSKTEVEWEFSEAALRETSEVPIGSVQHAAVQDIRASLAVQFTGADIPFAAVFSRGQTAPVLVPKELEDMPKELLILLGLAMDATADQVLAAVQAMKTNTTATAAELGIASSKLSAFEGDIKALKASERQRREDEFVLGAVSSGRIVNGGDKHWRALFSADEKHAVELMAEVEANSATPVGAPRQSDKKPDPAVVILAGDDKPGFIMPRAMLAARGSEAMTRLREDRNAAMLAAKIFGFHVPGHRFTQAELAATSINGDSSLASARIAWNGIFLDQGPYMPSPVLQLAYETTTTKESEMYRFLVGAPQMEEWKNDRIMGTLSALGMQVANAPYQATLKLKNRDIENDSLGLIGPIVEDMRSDARNHPASLIAQFLKDAFTTKLGFDGDVFFATTHATGSNKVAAAFSAVEFANAIALLRKQKRLDGVRYLDAKPTHLYVGIDNEALAEKILKQETLASGETNMNKGKTELVVVPDFTTEWIVADQSRASRPVVLQNRHPLTTSTIGGSSPDGAPKEDFVGFVYNETWFGVQAAYGVGGWDFRRAVGGKP